MGSLGSYSGPGDTDRGVKWFTTGYLDCMAGVDLRGAACELVRRGHDVPCLHAGVLSNHGPHCFTGVTVTRGERTWTLTGAHESGETFTALEGLDRAAVTRHG